MPISKAAYREMHGFYSDCEGARVNLSLEESASAVYRTFCGVSEEEI